MKRFLLLAVACLATTAVLAQLNRTPIPRSVQADCDDLTETLKEGDKFVVKARNTVQMDCDIPGYPSEVVAEAGNRIVLERGFRARHGSSFHARIRKGLKTSNKWDGVLDRATTSGEIHVFPNPSKGDIYAALPEGGQASSVRVFDMMGKTMLTREGVSGTLLYFDLNDLPAGVYFMQVSNNTHKTTTKVVLQ